jgi:hypothetical protein
VFFRNIGTNILCHDPEYDGKKLIYRIAAQCRPPSPNRPKVLYISGLLLLLVFLLHETSVLKKVCLRTFNPNLNFFDSVFVCVTVVPKHFTSLCLSCGKAARHCALHCSDVRQHSSTVSP